MSKSLAILLTVVCVGLLLVSEFESHAQRQIYCEELPNNSPHPRLLLNDLELKTFRKQLNDSAFLTKVSQTILTASDKYLKTKPLEYELKGIRLLDVSREALKRIFYLSYSYRLTGDTSYARRGIDELKTVCQFNDWNPAHFLDVGEMAMAVAIGYDWLYPMLTPDDKSLIIRAIKEKAFLPAFEKRYNRFKRLDNNWNSVCNAGLLYAALAIYEDEPELAKETIKECISTNFKAVNKYGPDGGYPEGYMYWDYGTTFQILLIDALIRNLNSDFGLLDMGGFRDTGRYIQFMKAPSGKCCNFSDCTEGSTANIPLWWFADINQDTSLTYLQSDFSGNYFNSLPLQSRCLPLIPVFLSRQSYQEISSPKENFWMSRGETPVFIYREGWESNKDAYLAVKGGSPKTPHAHMDGGSFIYEYDGVRWAMDLGMPEYHNLEKQGVKLWDGSQNGQRWEIMKMRNDCHNTLTIDRGRHNISGNADIIHTYESPNRKGALVDLTSLLFKVEKARREVSLNSYNHLTVRDTVKTGDSPVELTWTMVTPADAYIDENKIILRQGEKKMKLSIKAPLEFRLQILGNDPIHSYDQPNGNTRRVGFTVSIPANKEMVFEVRLTP